MNYCSCSKLPNPTGSRAKGFAKLAKLQCTVFQSAWRNLSAATGGCPSSLCFQNFRHLVTVAEVLCRSDSRFLVRLHAGQGFLLALPFVVGRCFYDGRKQSSSTVKFFLLQRTVAPFLQRKQIWTSEGGAWCFRKTAKRYFCGSWGPNSCPLIASHGSLEAILACARRQGQSHHAP